MHYQLTSIGEMAELNQKRYLIDSNEVNCNFQKCTKLSGTYNCFFHKRTKPTLGFVRIFEQLNNIFLPVAANLVAGNRTLYLLQVARLQATCTKSKNKFG